MNAMATAIPIGPANCQQPYTPGETRAEQTVSEQTTTKKRVSREGGGWEEVESASVTTKATTTRTITYCSNGGSFPSSDAEEQATQSFLEYVYMLSDAGLIQEPLDAIFQKMNRLLTTPNFRLAGKILAQTDVSRLTPTLLVGFLSITLASSRFLKERPQFYALVRARILAERGPEATASLLDKYNGR